MRSMPTTRFNTVTNSVTALLLTMAITIACGASVKSTNPNKDKSKDAVAPEKLELDKEYSFTGKIESTDLGGRFEKSYIFATTAETNITFQRMSAASFCKSGESMKTILLLDNPDQGSTAVAELVPMMDDFPGMVAAGRHVLTISFQGDLSCQIASFTFKLVSGQ